MKKNHKLISSRCFFCKLPEETITYLFYDCLIVKKTWNRLKSLLSNNINFPISTPQSAIFGFWDLHTNEHLILNHLLLIFKIYIYNARTTGYLNISHLLVCIKGIKDTEKKLLRMVQNEKKIQSEMEKCFSKLTEVN